MLYYNNVPFALDRYEISENQSLANAGSLLKINTITVYCVAHFGYLAMCLDTRESLFYGPNESISHKSSYWALKIAIRVNQWLKSLAFILI